MQIKKVSIIGANGTVGAGVSALFASFGNCKVYMICRSDEKAQKAVEKAALCERAYSIKENMIPVSYANIENCIKDSDLIIETIIEDLGEKKKIHNLINQYSNIDTIVATVTSGISINELASCYDKDKIENFLGIHFFNPPYSMNLTELIPSDVTSSKIVDEIRNYLEKILVRRVIEVKDTPAFLANRIGFYYINKAMRYAYIYRKNGGIDYIDSILGLYTGKNMAPLETADFVGLDIHKAIVDNIYMNTNEEDKPIFKLPMYVNDLIEEGKIGNKVGVGLYSKLKNQVYDIETKQYRDVKKYDFKFKQKAIEYYKYGEYQKGINVIFESDEQEAKICKEFMIDYIVYSLIVSDKIAKHFSDCDIAMADGFNWIPPMALIELIGQERVLNYIKIQYADNKIVIEKIEEIFSKSLKSIYGYERYIKAKE